MKIVFGKIEEGRLNGKKVILFPRDKDIPENLYWVEKGAFLNGSPQFALYCLNKDCEKEVPGKCNKCNV